jgi:hypothetical protein
MKLDVPVAATTKTATGISTIADTWIHLSYIVQEGERNRALRSQKDSAAANGDRGAA